MTEITGLNFSYLPNGNAEKLYQQIVTDAKHEGRRKRQHPYTTASNNRPTQAEIAAKMSTEVRVLSGDRPYLTEPGSGSIEAAQMTISSGAGTTTAKAAYCIETLKHM